MLSVISYPLFALTVVLALVLSISWFPVGWFEFRPEWLGLIVFYWTFRAPAQFGIVMAWCLGLLLDILESTPLGVNAMAMALIAFLVLTVHHRLRMYPLPQQCLMVFLLVGINQMLVHFVKQLFGADTPGFSYLWPALTSAVAWPFVSGLLDSLNRKLG
ncbi:MULTISPECIES: rod shape-determining protein MreD [Marinobacter]|jgi:rod shape-determining protein MreD|uniref:Rod shape-determining protein MreD n=2 Tax=Gammaproteobacteria TaxID=1236 RepID=A0A259W5R6_9GAMM|nr:MULTISPECIES: rod shape-determining protein MreD [Marinobacter]ERP90598.1 rod shape-determining protein MreD [Marinobacter sp. ES-1]KRW81951.1 rod shape-determining protein MreD [Marinobacter sp. P4B1]MCE0760384.1 rod shape-determining protein MreD [Marinobacter sp. G11]OZC37904.1 rod shape-determining protein MreD [Marinobacter vinifirmus]TVT35477.1 MAG: rod shape-determining protein MreD [Marinobacter vinifirmus]|tara:strand:+ start:288 stop:764 length:477 start_codon:yes stop_codon:yes gene_type:complete